MKKITLFILTVCLFLSIAGCDGNYNKLERVEKNIIEKLDNKIDDVKMVSKYGEVYIFSYEIKPLDLSFYTSYQFGDIKIYSDKVCAYIGGYYLNNIYELEELYCMGLLVKEDYLDINNKFWKTEDTFEIIETTGHIHNFNEWDIEGDIHSYKKKAICNICDIKIYEELVHTSCKFNSGVCTECNGLEETYLNESQYISENLKIIYNENPITFLMGVDNMYFYYIGDTMNNNLSVFKINSRYYSFNNVIVYVNGNIYYLQDAFDVGIVKINNIIKLSEEYAKSLDSAYLYNIELTNVYHTLRDYAYDNYAIYYLPLQPKEVLHINTNQIFKVKEECYVGVVSGLYKNIDNYVNISGYQFQENGGMICVYISGDVYLLNDAFDKGLITPYEIGEIYKYFVSK